MFVINHLLHPLTIDANKKKYLSDKEEDISKLIGTAVYAITAFGLILARRPQVLGFKFNLTLGASTLASFYVATAYFKKIRKD